MTKEQEQNAEAKAAAEKLRAAVRYLRRYQDWRTGKDVRTMNEAGIKPTELTRAIDTILEFLCFPKPLTDCANCKYNGDVIGNGFVGCIRASSFETACKYEPTEDAPDTKDGSTK